MKMRMIVCTLIALVLCGCATPYMIRQGERELAAMEYTPGLSGSMLPPPSSSMRPTTGLQYQWQTRPVKMFLAGCADATLAGTGAWLAYEVTETINDSHDDNHSRTTTITGDSNQYTESGEAKQQIAGDDQ